MMMMIIIIIITVIIIVNVFCIFVKIQSQYMHFPFKLADVVFFAIINYCIAWTVPSQDVCLSICLSHWCSVKTAKHILKRFSSSGSPTIVVFPQQTVWQYSDGDPLMGGRIQGVWENRDLRPISV